jgi:hypothetical protein
MKIKLYKAVPEYLYGDDRQEKREKQQQALVNAGVFENDDGWALVTSDQALALLYSGYFGSYLSPNHLAPVAEVDGPRDFEQVMEALANKFADGMARLTDGRFNEKCGQEQPGLPLNAITETMLVESGCTDAIQDHLANGWRILAIQPQPDQRRPDYILGRACNPGRLQASASRGVE